MKTLHQLLFDVFLALAIISTFTGCAALTPQVVTTEIERTPDGFRIVSPKDVTVKGLRIAPDGTLSVDEWQAKASPETLAAGAAEAASRAEAVGKLATAAAALR